MSGRLGPTWRARSRPRVLQTRSSTSKECAVACHDVARKQTGKLPRYRQRNQSLDPTSLQKRGTHIRESKGGTHSHMYPRSPTGCAIPVRNSLLLTNHEIVDAENSNESFKRTGKGVSQEWRWQGEENVSNPVAILRGGRVGE